nr:MAG TPA: hypothetical protein [Bacteriophage sp.]DAK53476.1 MAG TPA: hypothetical protein [Bacteriophage sp.]DAY96894.1 MAG TPA: hypothetical protein [Caudoviricetes sp.]
MELLYPKLLLPLLCTISCGLSIPLTANLFPG